MHIKLEGNLASETISRKLMAVILGDKQSFGAWIIKGRKLQIKLNDLSVVKEASLIELKTHFEFNLN